MSLINEFTQFKFRCQREAEGCWPTLGSPSASARRWSRSACRWVRRLCPSGADGPPPSLGAGACEFGKGAFLSSLFPSLSPENPVTYPLGVTVSSRSSGDGPVCPFLSQGFAFLHPKHTLSALPSYLHPLVQLA